MQAEGLPLLFRQHLAHHVAQARRQEAEGLVDAVVLVLARGMAAPAQAGDAQDEAQRPERHRDVEIDAGRREAELVGREGAERDAAHRIEERERQAREDRHVDRDHRPAVLAALPGDPQAEDQHQGEHADRSRADQAAREGRGLAAALAEGEQRDDQEHLEEHPAAAGRQDAADDAGQAEEARHDARRRDQVAREPGACAAPLGPLRLAGRGEEHRHEHDHDADRERRAPRADERARGVDLEAEQQAPGGHHQARERELHLGRERRARGRGHRMHAPSSSGNRMYASRARPSSRSARRRKASKASG